MRIFLQAAAIACVSLLTSVAAIGSAQAQSLPEPLPIQPQTDANGVDLVNRTLLLGGLGGVSIGQPGSGGLSFSRIYSDGGWRHSGLGTVSSSGSTYTVSVGSGAESFTKSGSTFTSDQGMGGELEYEENCWFDIDLQETICAYKRYTYTDRYGAVYQFDKLIVANGAIGDAAVNEGALTKAFMPDGEVISYNYGPPIMLNGAVAGARVQSITNNLGYQIHLYYARNTVTTGSHLIDWRRITKATAFDTDVDTCNPLANSCSFSQTWPYVTYTGPNFWTVASATDALGRTTTFTHNVSTLTGIRLPGTSSPANDVTYAYNAGGVSSVTAAGVTHNYATSDSAGVRTVTVSGPLLTETIVKSNLTTGRITSSKNGVGNVTSFTYDTKNRIKKVTAPEGNSVEYVYDARGNVTTTKFGSKSGTTIRTAIATFPACTTSNKKTCNKPTRTTTTHGKHTDYTYSTTHGGLLTVKSPAVGGVRQRITNTYSSYISGAVWRLTKSATCPTAEQCGGSANEAVTEYAYSGSHLQVASITNGNGSGSLQAQTAFAYNDFGDVTEVDGPIAGSADKAYTFYDNLRRPTGAISPETTVNASTIIRRATRTSYTTRGLVDKVEQGRVTGTSASSLAAMTVFLKTDNAHDSDGRLIERETTRGPTTFLTHWSYDAAGRIDCTAQRMVDLATAPTDACTVRYSSTYGYDRVSRTYFDAANRVTQVWAGRDSGAGHWETRYTYTANGKVASVQDANNNITTYTYEHFDRPRRTTFPGGSYEELTYDAGDRVTELRLRDNQEIFYTYDDRDRVTFADAPGAGTDFTYSYDLMGRMTLAESNQTNRKVSTAYDALSRVTSTTANNKTVSYDYDLAGRRTKMTWPDAFYVNYDYDDAGMLTKIRENGAVSGVGVLASFQYNGLGQRIKTTRGNGTDTDYSFTSSTPPLTDGLLPTQLDHDFAGTADDLSVGFEYNPAGQITMRDSDNDAYSYDAFASVTIASVNNALNQTTSVGGVSTTHDNRGNMTNDGTHAYVYDALNRMTRRAVGEVLQYDAFNRLFQAEDGAAKRRFLYDGSEIIAEMTTAGVIEKRYVRGPGADEVLVEYDTTGVSDVRTWLYADERGSVIAGANDSGTRTFVNTYDEFGNPASANTGSFQYTGQLWLTEVELYHYKARQYNPEIGRFMQTDPIGYGDGMNMYNYVGSDSVNGRDPSGLARFRGGPTNRDGGGGSRENSSCSRFGGRCDGAGGGADAVLQGLGTGGGNASANAGGSNRKRRGGRGGAASGNNRGSSSATFSGDTIIVTATRSVNWWVFSTGFWYANNGINSATGQIEDNPEFAAAAAAAWEASNPDGPTAQKREVGFFAVARWITGLTPTVTIYDVVYGDAGVAGITLGYPPNAASGEVVIDFHTHPFTRAENFIPGPSDEDIAGTNRFGITGVILNHSGYVWYGAPIY